MQGREVVLVLAACRCFSFSGNFPNRPLDPRMQVLLWRTFRQVCIVFSICVPLISRSAEGILKSVVLGFCEMRHLNDWDSFAYNSLNNTYP